MKNNIFNHSNSLLLQLPSSLHSLHHSWLAELVVAQFHIGEPYVEKHLSCLFGIEGIKLEEEFSSLEQMVADIEAKLADGTTDPAIFEDYQTLKPPSNKESPAGKKP